jgi:hypothetical protein
MFSEQTLIIINVACIAFLAMMLLVLASDAGMKGGAGWAAIKKNHLFFSNRISNQFFYVVLRLQKMF